MGGGGSSQKMTIADEGGGVSGKCPNLANIICEQPPRIKAVLARILENQGPCSNPWRRGGAARIVKKKKQICLKYIYFQTYLQL